VSGQYATVIANYSWATIVQINQAFSLNAISTLTVGTAAEPGGLVVNGTTTTSTLTVAGNLTVSGNILGNVYSGPDSGSATWMWLGTWTTVQNGESLYMRLISHAGYNGVANQNQVTELMFATANGTGGPFYANGLATVNSRLGTGGSGAYSAPQYFRIKQVSTTSYQFYIYYAAAYMGRANYTVQIGPATSWMDYSSTIGSAPTGTYLDITPTTF
jgi:hypothetical protein